jgi:hypothetical protein
VRAPGRGRGGAGGRGRGRGRGTRAGGVGGSKRAGGEASAQVLRPRRKCPALGRGGGVCWRCPALASTEQLLRLVGVRARVRVGVGDGV